MALRVELCDLQAKIAATRRSGVDQAVHFNKKVLQLLPVCRLFELYVLTALLLSNNQCNKSVQEGPTSSSFCHPLWECSLNSGASGWLCVYYLAKSVHNVHYEEGLYVRYTQTLAFTGYAGLTLQGNRHRARLEGWSCGCILC